MNRFWMKSFFLSLSVAGGPICWLLLFSCSLSEVLSIAVFSFAAVFLPWHRIPTVGRMLWVVALGSAFVTGITVSEFVSPSVGLWQWIVAWIVLLVAILYCGAPSLYRASGLMCGLVLLTVFFSLLLSTSQLVGSVSFAAPSLAKIASGTVVLLGSCLCPIEAAPRRSAARWGAVAMILLWTALAVLALLCWSEAARSVLPMPLFSLWQRLRMFRFSCPDSLFAAGMALSALWQCALGMHRLREL